MRYSFRVYSSSVVQWLKHFLQFESYFLCKRIKLKCLVTLYTNWIFSNADWGLQETLLVSWSCVYCHKYSVKDVKNWKTMSTLNDISLFHTKTEENIENSVCKHPRFSVLIIAETISIGKDTGGKISARMSTWKMLLFTQQLLTENTLLSWNILHIHQTCVMEYWSILILFSM